MRNTAPGGKSGSYEALDFDVNLPRDNVLTPECLSKLKSAEDEVMNSADFPKFCHKDTENDLDCVGQLRSCALPFSLTNNPLLYGEYNGTRVCNRKANSDTVSEAQFSEFMKAITLDGAGIDPIWSVFLGIDFNSSNAET